MDGVFLGLAGLLLKISLGLCPREILQSSPASPYKTQFIPPLLLGLTQILGGANKIKSSIDINLLIFPIFQITKLAALGSSQKSGGHAALGACFTIRVETKYQVDAIAQVLTMLLGGIYLFISYFCPPFILGQFGQLVAFYYWVFYSLLLLGILFPLVNIAN